MSEPSKGVGFANWLVSKTSGFLDSRLSRRSFIARTTLVGTAVAATGCSVVVEQGNPYTRITECPPGTLCRDGYTEFCCVINHGVNACPSGTVAAGWWRADYSVYCNGTRYYIDCNETCCGPLRGDGFCAGCHACQCGAGCDTRKVWCNYFRYGQCNQWIAHVGPIACRMVTCTPPYNLNIGCTASGAVDNSTAGHNANCAAYGPPPPPPVPNVAALLPGLSGATAPTPGAPAVFARFTDNGIYYRQLVSGTWTPWAAVGGIATSGGSALPFGSGQMIALTRLADNALWQFVGNGASWPATNLGGALRSDPVAVLHNGEIFVFARGTDGGYYWRRYTAGAWTPWAALFGVGSSTPVAASLGTTLFLFGRLADNAPWYATYSGGTWSSATSLQGVFTSDPGAAAVGSSMVVFGQSTDGVMYYRRLTSGTWSSYAPLGPIFSDPVAVTVGSSLYVFARVERFELAYRRTSDGISWDPWTVIGPSIQSDPAVAVDGTSMHVFAQYAKGRIGRTSFDGATWSPWEDLDGDLSLVRGN